MASSNRPSEASARPRFARAADVRVKPEEFLVVAHGQFRIPLLLGVGRILEEFLRIGSLRKNSMGEYQDQQGREAANSNLQPTEVEGKCRAQVFEASRARRTSRQCVPFQPRPPAQ